MWFLKVVTRIFRHKLNEKGHKQNEGEQETERNYTRNKNKQNKDDKK